MGYEVINYAKNAQLTEEGIAKPMQDIKFLMQNKQNIFNVTPPNKKDDRKQALLAAKKSNQKSTL